MGNNEITLYLDMPLGMTSGYISNRQYYGVNIASLLQVRIGNTLVLGIGYNNGVNINNAVKELEGFPTITNPTQYYILSADCPRLANTTIMSIYNVSLYTQNDGNDSEYFCAQIMLYIIDGKLALRFDSTDFWTNNTKRKTICDVNYFYIPIK